MSIQRSIPCYPACVSPWRLAENFHESELVPSVPAFLMACCLGNIMPNINRINAISVMINHIRAINRPAVNLQEIRQTLVMVYELRTQCLVCLQVMSYTKGFCCPKMDSFYLLLAFVAPLASHAVLLLYIVYDEERWLLLGSLVAKVLQTSIELSTLKKMVPILPNHNYCNSKTVLLR